MSYSMTYRATDFAQHFGHTGGWGGGEEMITMRLFAAYQAFLLRVYVVRTTTTFITVFITCQRYIHKILGIEER